MSNVSLNDFYGYQDETFVLIHCHAYYVDYPNNLGRGLAALIQVIEMTDAEGKVYQVHVRAGGIDVEDKDQPQKWKFAAETQGCFNNEKDALKLVEKLCASYDEAKFNPVTHLALNAWNEYMTVRA